MKRFLAVFTSLILVFCIGFLASGCTIKVKGKNFTYDEIEIKVSTKNLTADERKSSIDYLKALGVNVNENMSDKKLQSRLDDFVESSTSYSAIKTIEALYKNVVYKFDKKKVKAFAGNVETMSAFYRQDGKTITFYIDSEMKTETEAEKLTVSGDEFYIKVNDTMCKAISYRVWFEEMK